MEIPVALRRWFIAHFAINVVIGAPLLLFPELFLGLLRWQVIDQSSARFGAATLLAIGIQSFAVRDARAPVFRIMLQFKLLWSWIVIGALVLAIVDGGPDAVWPFLAIYIALSGVWFHYHVRLGQFEAAIDEEEAAAAELAGDAHGDPESDGQEIANLLKEELVPTDAVDRRPGEAERVHAGTSFDKVGAQDINALFAARQAEEAKRKAEEEARRKAQVEAEMAAWNEAGAAAPPARAGSTIVGVAPAAEELGSDDIAAMLAEENARAAAARAQEDAASADEIVAMLAGGGPADSEPEPESESEPAPPFAAVAETLLATPAAPPAPPSPPAPAPMPEEPMDDEAMRKAALEAELKAWEEADLAASAEPTLHGHAPAEDDVVIDEVVSDGIGTPIAAGDDGRVRGDDIAALLAAENARAGAATGPTVRGRAPVKAEADDDEDGASTDDIAAMLAQNREA